MDEQSLQRVFEPFYTTKNLDVVNGVSIEGDGLGLWNTYHILKVAGGDIQLTSVPGMGTTVTLRLPVSPSTAEPAAV
jgi:signal transduction histidine kinase